MHTKAKHPGRVLVMDDERSVQLLLDRVLTGAGHSVSIVESGEAALNQLSAQPYDLMIADKNLPGVDGLEVLRQARTRHPNLQAVIITGFPTPESKYQAESLGVHAFVTKPFGILEFLEICDAALERCTAS
ncbi:MAG TPA: response regulator [Myxococcaceae bacterium]|nr:response regulator [Myxococcaceae bacterium]